jgi:hypothetical protein
MEERDLKRVMEHHMLEYQQQTGLLPGEVEDAEFENVE